MQHASPESIPLSRTKNVLVLRQDGKAFLFSAFPSDCNVLTVHEAQGKYYPSAGCRSWRGFQKGREGPPARQVGQPNQMPFRHGPSDDAFARGIQDVAERPHRCRPFTRRKKTGLQPRKKAQNRATFKDPSQRQHWDRNLWPVFPDPARLQAGKEANPKAAEAVDAMSSVLCGAPINGGLSTARKNSTTRSSQSLLVCCQIQFSSYPVIQFPALPVAKSPAPTSRCLTKLSPQTKRRSAASNPHPLLKIHCSLF